jgi:hypothetical protein
MPSTPFQIIHQWTWQGEREARPYPVRQCLPRRGQGDRPQRQGDRPQRQGDRPQRQGDRPQRQGDRPQRAGRPPTEAGRPPGSPLPSDGSAWQARGG